jgi:hypothetical protein
MRARFALLALLFAAAAHAQAPSPAQMGITSTTTPEVLQTLDSTKTWVPLGTVDPTNHVWSGYGADTDVRSFGCVADGSTDQSACINKALTSAPGCVVIPPSANGFYVTNTITVQRCLRGTLWNPGSPSAGFAGQSWIKCGTSATANGICVQKSGASSSVGSAVIENLTIVGASATPAAGSVGYSDVSGYNDTSRNLYVTNFDTCASWGPVTGGGVSSWNYNFMAAHCQKHFIVNDGWPELHFIGGRLGTNSETSPFTTTDDYVYFTLTGAYGPTAGPNTVELFGMQWNTWGSVGCAVRWGGYTGSGGLRTLFRITNVHAEWAQAYTGSNTTGFFCSDSTVPNITALWVTNNDFAVTPPGAAALFNLNAATKVRKWRISGNWFGGTIGSSLTVSTDRNSSDKSYFINNEFPYSLTLTAGSNSYLSLIGNEFGNALTLAGAWNDFSSTGNTITSGFVDTATGSVAMADGKNIVQTWTPVLSFGGASVGVTYSTQQGEIWRTASGGFAGRYSILLSSKGSSTGNALISGIPYVCANQATGYVPNTIASFTGLTGAVYAALSGGNTIIPLQSGTGGGAVLTNAVFTNTTQIVGTFSCGTAS